MSLTTEQVWESFSQPLRVYLQRRVPDPGDADDLLQEIFIKVHLRLADLRSGDRLGPWLYQIARNTLTDYYRTTRRFAPLQEDLPLEEPEEPDAASRLAQGLAPMIHCLPEKYGQALELSELGGLKQHELANQLGISLSGAKSRIQRGRVMLRQALFDCCHFEFDRRGRVIDYAARIACCRGCQTV